MIDRPSNLSEVALGIVVREFNMLPQPRTLRDALMRRSLAQMRSYTKFSGLDVYPPEILDELRVRAMRELLGVRRMPFHASPLELEEVYDKDVIAKTKEDYKF